MLHPVCGLPECVPGLRKDRRAFIRIRLHRAGGRGRHAVAGGHQSRQGPVSGRDPVRRLPGSLLALREKLAEGDPAWQVTPADRTEKRIWQAWSWVIRKRAVYDLALRLAAVAQKLLPQRNGMIRRLPPPINGWTQGRDLRPLAKKRFIRRWKKDPQHGA